MINGFIYVLCHSIYSGAKTDPGQTNPGHTNPKQTKHWTDQTQDRTNHGQVQTLERYKPWAGMNPGQV